MRPTSIKVQLYMNADKYGDPVEFNEANNWSYTWYDLPPVKVVDGYMVGDMSISYVAMEVGEVSYYVGDPDWTSDPHKTTITNTYTPEKIEIEGFKTWDDNNNQDGKRPESIKINLYADGEYLDSRTVTEADKWKWTFDNLDVYVNGTPIEYTITEDAVEGYTTQINGFNVTNTHTPEKTEISGSKTWDDNNNQDGIRPDSITIHLFANGSEVDSRTVTEKQNWSWTFDELPKKEKGVDIVYTITEDPVEGYTTIVKGPDVTNTHVPATVSLTVKKSWNDNENQDGIRPDYIDVQLLADGTAYGEPLRLSDECGWERTWENLPKLSGGTAIKYSVEELPEIKGYLKTSAINYKDDGKTITITLTNTHNLEKTVVSGSKTWDDNNNQDGKRPESITINLFANGKKIDSKTVTAADNWSWTFNELDKYSGGKLIVYTITEESVDGYATIVNDFDVTNTHNLEKTVVSGSKTWDDNNNQDGKRPESITINLFANGKKIDSKTVTAADNWSWTFNELDKYSGGKLIVYTITEESVDGYATIVNDFDVTNTHNLEKTVVSGSKTWDDNNNQDGKRPESITINLLANGKNVDGKTVTEADNWSWTFDNLDVYANGNKITYTITEDEVTDYASQVIGYNVTNTHTPETITISGTKTWEDNDNQDGIRPKSVTIHLWANGTDTTKTAQAAKESGWKYTFSNLPKYENGREIVYTITEGDVADYTPTINGFNVTNTHTPETITISGTKTWEDNNQDGKRPESITINLFADGTKKTSKVVTPNAEGEWEYTFENLPKYENGTEIKYTIEEVPVEGYVSDVHGYDVTNTHTPETITISGTKTWEDNNNQDGVRPTSITINLFADGTKKTSKVVTPNAEGEWEYTFENLPKYENGTEIKYTIEEVPVEGYVSDVHGYDVTNTHTPETITISGTKTWEDNNNQDGVRPTSITINLLADGTKKASKTITPNAEGKWEYTFENLPKNRNGKAIVYTIEEIKVEGYESKVDGYNVINTHIPETTELTVVKLWDDGNDFDSIRPSSITVRLLADGSEYGDKMVLNAHNNWTAKWENLPKYDNGTEIKYTVEEEPVLGYSASYSGIIGNTITITNTHAPQKYDNYISISGHKIWDDSNDILGIRPDSITVYLLADGVVRRTAMVTAANGWQWHFNDLDKYHNGVPVVYTVYEEPVEGYISRVDGYNIINYYIPEPLEPDIPVEAEQGSDSVDHSVSADSGVMAVAISVLLGTALAIGLAKILARKVNS